MIRSNKQESPSTEPVQPRPISDRIQTPPMPEPIHKSATATAPSHAAVIGPKIRVKGELVGEEDLLIQGKVDGTIELKGNNLTIGEQGVVKANVLAQTIVIEGTIEGDIYGEDHISILSSSNVKGNLVANRVTLEDGAKFKGSIDMEVDARKDDFQKFNAGSSFSSSTPASAPASSSSKSDS